MKRALSGVFLLLSLTAISQLDDSLNTIALENFKHFTDTVVNLGDFEIDDIKTKGHPSVVLFKNLYIQKHQGIWMYDADSCAIKHLKASKMAYFSSGTKAIYCGLSFDVGVKERKTLRAVSYEILEDLDVGDTIQFTLTTLADRGSTFQPDIYTSKRLKVRRGKLKNGDHLIYFGKVTNASTSDLDLVKSEIRIPVTEEMKGVGWVHLVNNEEEQHKGFIIENGYHLGGVVDDEYQRIYFQNDSYELSNKAKLLLNKIVVDLKPSNAIVLRGYADPSGQKEYNMRLAKNRAQAVMDFLIEKGVDESRVKIEEFDILHNKSAKENRICTILVL